jgi:hypothetical protein
MPFYEMATIKKKNRVIIGQLKPVIGAKNRTSTAGGNR